MTFPKVCLVVCPQQKEGRKMSTLLLLRTGRQEQEHHQSQRIMSKPRYGELKLPFQGQPGQQRRVSENSNKRRTFSECICNVFRVKLHRNHEILHLSFVLVSGREILHSRSLSLSTRGQIIKTKVIQFSKISSRLKC